MNVAELFLVSVLRNRDIKTFAKVKKSWFDSSEVPLYNFIKDYFMDNGELPGAKSFCKLHRLDYKLADSRPTAYLRMLKERYVFSDVADKVPDFLKSLKGDPLSILNKMKTYLNEVSMSVEGTNTKDAMYSEDTADRHEEYIKRTETGGITYVSSGHKLWDELFYGYHRGDLITLAGRAGSKKSWLLCYLVNLLDEYLVENDADEEFGDILVISNEMTIESINSRIDCIRFKLPFSDYMKGELSPKKSRVYAKGLSMLKKSRIRILYNCTTCDELEAKILLYNPCAVFLDGSYLLEPGMKNEGWEKITYITRNLKRIAKSNEVPIFNTTQQGRGKGTKRVSNFEAQDSFAYTNSYSQDSDLALVSYITKEMMFHNLVGLIVAKGRNVEDNTEIIFRCPLGSMDLDFELPDAVDSDDDSQNKINAVW